MKKKFINIYLYTKISNNNNNNNNNKYNIYILTFSLLQSPYH